VNNSGPWLYIHRTLLSSEGTMWVYEVLSHVLTEVTPRAEFYSVAQFYSVVLINSIQLHTPCPRHAPGAFRFFFHFYVMLFFCFFFPFLK
jgi:hypothetical protein